MKCLFIGGAQDGKRLDVDVRRYEIRMHADRSIAPRRYLGLTTVSTEQSYRREEFSEADKSYFVYVFAIQPGAVLAALLDGYRQPTQDNQT